MNTLDKVEEGVDISQETKNFAMFLKELAQDYTEVTAEIDPITVTEGEGDDAISVTVDGKFAIISIGFVERNVRPNETMMGVYIYKTRSEYEDVLDTTELMATLKFWCNIASGDYIDLAQKLQSYGFGVFDTWIGQTKRVTPDNVGANGKLVTAKGYSVGVEIVRDDLIFQECMSHVTVVSSASEIIYDEDTDYMRIVDALEFGIEIAQAHEADGDEGVQDLLATIGAYK